MRDFPCRIFYQRVETYQLRPRCLGIEVELELVLEALAKECYRKGKRGASNYGLEEESTQ